jgi:hypothetical protein
LLEPHENLRDDEERELHPRTTKTAFPKT